MVAVGALATAVAIGVGTFIWWALIRPTDSSELTSGSNSTTDLDKPGSPTAAALDQAPTSPAVTQAPTTTVAPTSTAVVAAPVTTVAQPTTTVTTVPPTTIAATPAPNPVPAITSVSASVVRSDSADACGNPTSYQPANSVDGVNATAWMAPGDGVGATLTLNLSGPSIVTRVGLIPGYDKYDPCTGSDRFYDLRRITAVRWTFDDGTAVDHFVNPAPGMQVFELATPATTGTVTLTILSSVEPGDARLDYTPVSEVVIE